MIARPMCCRRCGFGCAQEYRAVGTKSKAAWCRDHCLSVRALQRADDVFAQLTRAAQHGGIPMESAPEDTTKLRRALTAGFFLQASFLAAQPSQPLCSLSQAAHRGPGQRWSAGKIESQVGGDSSRRLCVRRRSPQAARRQPDGSYKAISSGQVARFHPAGALHGRQPAPECVIYTELVQTTKMFIRGVSAIEPIWCARLALRLVHACAVWFVGSGSEFDAARLSHILWQAF